MDQKQNSKGNGHQKPPTGLPENPASKPNATTTCTEILNMENEGQAQQPGGKSRRLTFVKTWPKRTASVRTASSGPFLFVFLPAGRLVSSWW